MSERILALIRHNRDGLLYRGGASQPPLVLAVDGHFDALEPRWNLEGLGWKGKVCGSARESAPCVPREQLSQACTLHWTGTRKPWQNSGLMKRFWTPWSA